MDLEPFGRSNPGGYAGLQVTSVLDLGGPSSPDAMKPGLLVAMAAQFGLALQAAPPTDLPAPLPVAVAANSTQPPCAVPHARFPVPSDSRAGPLPSRHPAGGGGPDRVRAKESRSGELR